jgi:poly(3-hydroxybutyrate) depolymerase
MMHRGKPVDLTDPRVALMTVEGEKDDISGIGQTERRASPCASTVPESKKLYYMQKDVGHYGVFNGSRFRKEIAPRMCDFHAMIEKMDAAPKPKLVKAAG